MTVKRTSAPTPVEVITHGDKRVNIPTADAQDFVDPATRAPIELRYPRDPTLDPQLVWKGKDNQDDDDLVVEAPPLYIQEKVDPRVLVENLRRTAARLQDEPELALFDTFDGLEGMLSVEFYKHAANWSNRLILGDSLQVMGSLAEREQLRGQVQMIYLDPPYGIKFGSNWQVSTRKRDVKDGKLEDATREVEQIKAFRDTWELGVNSYLSYMRDRLVAARDLLTESGSVFVQIGDENVHRVRALMDEVFGSENFITQIIFVTTSSQTARELGSVSDTVLWYSRNRVSVKYRPLVQPKEPRATGGWGFNYVELRSGERRPLTREERSGGAPLPDGRLYMLDNLLSQGPSASGSQTFDFEGRRFQPSSNAHWKTTLNGMSRLAAVGRIQRSTNQIRYVRFFDDYAVQPMSNLWTDTTQAGFVDNKVYASRPSARSLRAVSS